MRLARLCTLIAVMLFAVVAGASGEEPAPLPDAGKAEAPEEPYRTPLAGKPYHTSLFGRQIDVPAFDRNNVRAFSLGSNFYSPSLGEEWFTPIAALYWKRETEESRLRAIVGVFMNEVEVARRFGKVELIGRFENDTVPFPATEISDGQEVKGSSIISGNFMGSLGAGLRQRVYPNQEDNDLRLQAFYQAGYLFSRPTSDTAPTVRLPPDTFLHGFKLRGRYDAMKRNVMELLHDGFAWGFDLDLVRRNHWGDANYGGNVFRGDDTRDYVKLSGYLAAATKVPYLTERDRLIVSVHAGYSPIGKLDRFSAFRIGGGLFPNEADDMRRPYFPGALYNQFPTTDFVITNFEYRRELLFFLYFHLRGTLIAGKRSDFQTTGVKILKDRGEAFSTGITCGMPFNSQLYMEYGYDVEVLRDDHGGSSFLVLWSKMF